MDKKKENAINKTPNDSPFIMVSRGYSTKIVAAMIARKGSFINDFLDKKKGELGRKKFDKQLAKLEAYAAKAWDLAQEGKRQFRKIEELSGKKLMEWKELEKPLRQWLENDAVGNDWGQDAVERTILSYRKDFERKQNHIRARQKRIKDPDADFRRRVLNPKTRAAAITKYIQNHRYSKHYMVMAFNILFEELEKQK